MNTKVLLASISTIIAYETMIRIPYGTHWIILALCTVLVICSIEKNNTSYSHLLTVLLSQIALTGTLLFTEQPVVEHFIVIIATVLTTALLSTALRSDVTEAQGRKETPMQRTIQAILLGILFLWYNVSIKVAEEFGIIVLVPILLNFGATTVITYHIQKTFAVAFQKNYAIAYAFLTGLFVAETTWVIIIWPFSFLTKAIAVSGVVFILWNLIELRLKKNVRVKTLLPSLLLGLAGIIAAVIIGPWNS